MCMSRTRLELKIYNFFQLPSLFQLLTLGRKSECVANLRDKTQIFTQTNSTWLILRISELKFGGWSLCSTTFSSIAERNSEKRLVFLFPLRISLPFRFFALFGNGRIKGFIRLGQERLNITETALNPTLSGDPPGARALCLSAACELDPECERLWFPLSVSEGTDEFSRGVYSSFY